MTTQPEQSHLWPMVPYLRALEAAGHELRVGSGAHFLTHVERAALPAVACGLDWGIGHAPEEQLRAMAMEDGVQQRHAFVEFFAGRAARQMAADVLELAERWRPDVVLSEWLEFGADAAAEVLDVPYLPISVGMRASPASLQEIAAPELQRLRDVHGLPSDPGCKAHYRHGCLSLFPPEWLPSDREPLDGEVFLAPCPTGLPSPTPTPGWPPCPIRRWCTQRWAASSASCVGPWRLWSRPWPPVAGRPWWPAVVSASPRRSARCRTTCGWSPGYRSEHCWPRSMSWCTNAGYSTWMDAALAGTPQTVLPLSADQPEHAEAVHRLGLGRVVPAVRDLPFGPIVERRRLSPEAVRTAVEQTLAEPRHRQRSAAIGERMRELPATDHFVDVVEQLAP